MLRSVLALPLIFTLVNCSGNSQSASVDSHQNAPDKVVAEEGIKEIGSGIYEVTAVMPACNMLEIEALKANIEDLIRKATDHCNSLDKEVSFDPHVISYFDGTSENCNGSVIKNKFSCI